MMRVLLDTSVFVAMEQERPLGDPPAAEARISVATLTELTLGVLNAPREDREKRAATLAGARRFIAMPYDEAVSDHLAGLLSALARARRKVGFHDAVIAATALAHDCTVLTQDEDFQILAELEPALRVQQI